MAGQDIRAAVESLPDAPALLASIVDSSDDAIISKNLNGIITSWNPAAEHLFGYTAREMIGMPIIKLIPPDLLEEERVILSKIRANQKVEHYETVRLRKNGERVHVSLTVSPVRDLSGKVIGASKIARDITLQREFDRAGAMLAAIVQSSDDAIISKDLNGTVTSWNPAAERLYGFTSEEMIGGPILKVIPPELLSEEQLILSKVRAGERIDHYETTRLTKTGRRLPVSITVSPIRDHTGRIVGASKIARDMTAFKESQRQKDQFLAVLAHELRNPLAPIRNALMILKHSDLGEDQRERALLMAERQTVQMSRLLDDLLDISRIATGKVELKRGRVELGELIQQSVEATAPMLHARGQSLQIDVTDDPMWLDADPVRIVQIFTNLLTNAAKYTDQGGKVSLTTVKERDKALVKVTDTGVGFTPEMKPRLFTLFSQAEGAVSRAAGGLGIGLALVREFVERHGGTVEATSPGPMRGSTFTVKLPLASGN